MKSAKEILAGMKLIKNPNEKLLDDNLLPRKITNTGTNTITIEVDPHFRPYLMAHKKPYQGQNTIAPKQSLFVPHMYVILTTDDGKPCNLFQEF